MFQILKNLFHIFECLAADLYYGFPARKLIVVGITGTDGKTTTAHLIYHILKTSGKKVSMISSIYADIGGQIHDTGFHVTTPRPWKVRQFLRKARDSGAEYFILETTSHALAQNRVWGIPFHTSVITNITHEHLYHHGSFENYLKIKTKLLLQSRNALVNLDSVSAPEVIKILVDKKKPFKTFSLKETKADFTWNAQIKSHIHGEYNRENILAAYGICLSLNLDKKAVLKGIASFELPRGRLDVVRNKEFKVVIDFAHTPNAIERLLQTIKTDLVGKNGLIIHVFGSASQRDDSKRPKMGEASAQYADIIILTEEDYRKEDPAKICEQIAQGIKKQGLVKDQDYFVVTDRAQAIEKAIFMAQRGDVVVVTGKSHEKSLARDGKEYPWDEYKTVRKALIRKK